MTDRYPMTKDGLKALKEELNHLKGVERPHIIEAIEEARSHGDLKENAEYHAAKEKYGFIQGRIDEINGRIALAEVIDPSDLSGDRVVFGATVLLEDMEEGEQVTYQIVGEDEADVKSGKINFKSPIAKSLIGKHEGDEVQVKTPKGIRGYEILKVEFK